MVTCIRHFGCSLSVALNPCVPVEIVSVLEKVDYVLGVTVGSGLGGQAYIPAMTDKVGKLHNLNVDRSYDYIEADDGAKANRTIYKFAEVCAILVIARSGTFTCDDLT